MAQNEIPESFLFDSCYTIHIGPKNVDKMPTFNDVWQEVLDQKRLEILTDLEANQAKMLKIELFAEWGASDAHSKNMKYIFEKQSTSKDQTSAFKEFLDLKQKNFKVELKQQETKTKIEMAKEKARKEKEAARQKKLEEERKRREEEEMALAEK